VVCIFPDPNLETVIRTALVQPTGDILRDDLLTITELEENTSWHIVDLSGMQCLENLTKLEFQSNAIVDLSPLSGLVNLHELDLDHNEIRDLSPLSGLTNLTRIDLAANQVSDVSPLAGLVNLEWLGLTWNEITDIGPLSGLTNLVFIGFSDNQISDLSPLAGLINLTNIGFWGNQIADISALSGLTNLTDLYASQNLISDISALSGLTQLEHLHLTENQVSDVSALSGLTNLDYVIFRDNQVSDISPLGGLTGLRQLYMDGNLISDIEPLLGITDLYDADVTDNLLDCTDPTTQFVIATIGPRLDSDCSVCVPSSDVCVDNGYDCGTAYHPDCLGIPVDCGTCTGPDECVANMCEACEDLRADTEVCGTGECGTVDDSCGVARSCGTCADPTDSCVANVCQPVLEGGVVYRCDSMQYGTDQCSDFLESDGWTAVEAEAECTAFSDPGTETFTTTTVAGSCKNTVDQGAFPKRCDACQVDTDDPAPRTCVGNDFYLYIPAFFPDAVCVDYMGGTIVPAPWPGYPLCPDPRTDGEVCGGAECGTVDDNCGTARSCGTCADPADSCVAGMCTGSGDIVYRCDGINYGADHCIDFLESDGWTAVTAAAECAAQSDPGTDTLTTTTLAGSCKNTVDQAAFPKRCDACEVDTNDPTPRPCVGNDFYLYIPAFFPDTVCVNYLGGTITPAPWPDY
jgi:Leucine-rich repeat (LRR) protein